MGPDVVLPRAGGRVPDGGAVSSELVLVLQVLPGHFQLAFMTQFVIVLIVVLGGRGTLGTACVWARCPCTRRRLRFSMRGAAMRCAGAGWRFFRWRPFSSGRRRGWQDWRPASAISSICPALRRRRSTWSTTLPRACSIARRSGGPWSGTRFIPRPKSFCPTSGWLPFFWLASRSVRGGAATRRCGCWRSVSS